jgi:hypothetical protein
LALSSEAARRLRASLDFFSGHVGGGGHQGARASSASVAMSLLVACMFVHVLLSFSICLGFSM